MPIYIGTGGYSDSDLCGILYPQDAKKTDYLRHYTEHYRAVEINSSFHAPLGQKAFAGMVEKSQGHLQFSVKLHQCFSHDLSGTPKQAHLFLQALQPLRQANRLAAILVQFPHGFDRTVIHRQYLAQLVQWFDDVPLVIGFRHPSWHCEKVVTSFQQQKLSWCSVDYPSIVGLPRSELTITAPIGYLRLHGQNRNWWDAYNAADRHDYRYSDGEMRQWAQAIAEKINQCDDLYIFFQNTVKGHAVYNIAMLRRALCDLNLPVA